MSLQREYFDFLEKGEEGSEGGGQWGQAGKPTQEEWATSFSWRFRQDTDESIFPQPKWRHLRGFSNNLEGGSSEALELSFSCAPTTLSCGELGGIEGEGGEDVSSSEELGGTEGEVGGELGGIKGEGGGDVSSSGELGGSEGEVGGEINEVVGQ